MPNGAPEPSSDALAAAEELRSFGDYILSNRDWRASRGPSEAIAAAARSRAGQILTESALENAQREQTPSEESEDLAHALEDLLNRYSVENASGTPDFILAEFLLGVLNNYNETVQKRAKWRGESVELPSLQGLGMTAPTVKKSFFGKDRKF